MAIINGTPGNDVVTGSTGDDIIKGLAGNDVLFGIDGNDQGYGGTGDDWLDGGIDDDSLNSGAGFDVLEGGGGNDTLRGATGDDQLFGGDGNDIYYVNSAGDSTREFRAADGYDRLYSTISWGLSDYIDRLTLLTDGNLDGTGNLQDNRIDGNSGDNVLYGLIGDDNLFGNAGDDNLVGGFGKETLRGGAGGDIFVYELVDDSVVGAGRDRIVDFQTGVDKIDLSGIDAVATVTGNQAFSFIGTALFTGKVGELRFDAGGVVQGDTNGDGAADFQIQVTAGLVLSGSDFVL